MPSPPGKHDYVLYDVDGVGRRTGEIKKCRKNQPSECVRQYGFSGMDRLDRQTRIVDVETITPKWVKVWRYLIRQEIVPIEPDRRAFKQERGIPNPLTRAKTKVLDRKYEKYERPPDINFVPDIQKSKIYKDVSPAGDPGPTGDPGPIPEGLSLIPEGVSVAMSSEDEEAEMEIDDFMEDVDSDDWDTDEIEFSFVGSKIWKKQ